MVTKDQFTLIKDAPTLPATSPFPSSPDVTSEYVELPLGHCQGKRVTILLLLLVISLILIALLFLLYYVLRTY